MSVIDDKLWANILQAFEQEAGEPPSTQPEGWELCLLARVAGECLGDAKRAAKRMERLLLAEGPNLDGCREVLNRERINLSQLVTRAKELVSRSLTSRSRSPRRRREWLRQAQAALDSAGGAWKNRACGVDVAAEILSAGRSLSQDQAMFGCVVG